MTYYSKLIDILKQVSPILHTCMRMYYAHSISVLVFVHIFNIILCTSVFHFLLANTSLAISQFAHIISFCTHNKYKRKQLAITNDGRTYFSTTQRIRKAEKCYNRSKKRSFSSSCILNVGKFVQNAYDLYLNLKWAHFPFHFHSEI